MDRRTPHPHSLRIFASWALGRYTSAEADTEVRPLARDTHSLASFPFAVFVVLPAPRNSILRMVKRTHRKVHQQIRRANQPHALAGLGEDLARVPGRGMVEILC